MDQETNEDVALERRFGRIESELAALRVHQRQVEGWMKDSLKFHQEMTSFVDTYKATTRATAETQSSRHQENQDSQRKTANRIALIGLILTLISLIGLGCNIYIASKASKTSQLFHSQVITNPQNAKNQNAGFPNDVTEEVHYDAK